MRVREVLPYGGLGEWRGMEQPRSRRDSPRIVGRFEERLAFHCIARRVYLALPQLHHDCNFPHQAFDHINLNFLREDSGRARLWGMCSFSKTRPYYSTLHQSENQIHRISLHRPLMKESLIEAIRTVHHEFVHAIIDDRQEPHNAVFQKHEARIESILNELQTEIKHDFRALNIEL